MHISTRSACASDLLSGGIEASLRRRPIPRSRQLIKPCRPRGHFTKGPWAGIAVGPRPAMAASNAGRELGQLGRAGRSLRAAPAGRLIAADLKRREVPGFWLTAGGRVAAPWSPRCGGDACGQPPRGPLPDKVGPVKLQATPIAPPLSRDLSASRPLPPCSRTPHLLRAQAS